MKKITVYGFKGCVTDKLPISLKPDELCFALNLDLNNDGSLTQRPGSELIQTFSQKVSLLKFNEIRKGTINEILIAIEGNKLYFYDEISNNFVLKYDDLDTSNDKWAGIGYISNFIFSNGKFTYRLYYDDNNNDYKVEVLSYKYKNNGTSQIVDISVDDIVYDEVGNITNDPQKYYKALVPQNSVDLSTENYKDTSKWHELGERSEIPSGLYFEQFDNRIFIAGDGSENLYFSNQGDATKYDALNFIALGTTITSLKAVGEFLFVGTIDGLYKLNATGNISLPYNITQITKDNILKNSLSEINAGIVGAITKSGRFLMFNQYAKQGSEILYQIGLPIRNILLTIIDDDLQVLKYKNKVIITCNIDNVYIPRSNKNNAQLVLNNVIYGWTFYNLPIFSLNNFKNNVFYADYNGNVFKFDENLFQDNDEDFEVYAITSIFIDKNVEQFKNFRRVFLIANPKTSVTMRLYWNLLYNIEFSNARSEDKNIYASGGIWGESKWGEFIWGGTYAEIPTFRVDGTGRGIQFKITKVSSNSDFSIQGYVIYYQPAYIKGTQY